ncbi:MAG: beta-lactamase family protein [Hellea sp.]|nr:beta-lactamase family protein [Hellea sp.]
MRRMIVSIMAGCVSLPALAGSINTDEVDRRIQQLMDRPEMAGLAVAIVENGEVTFSKGYGYADKATRKKVSQKTVFRWASLSKGVAATTVAQLSIEDKLELQTPITNYTSTLVMPGSNYDVSLEDVLAQRTGLTSNAYDVKIEDGQAAKKVRGALGDVRRVCEPGECHSYQNVIFDSAAEAVEQAAGLPYKTVVTQNIFDPLGMESASVSYQGLHQSADWARPHNRYGNRISKVKPTYYRIPAAAGVNSSVEDLAKWMQAQFPQDSLLGPDVLSLTQTPRISTPREDRKMRRHYGALTQSRYGLGWRIYDLDGRQVVGHRGAVEGYRASILFDPELKTGVAILWNSSHSRPAGLALEVFDQVYENPRRDWMRLGPGKALPHSQTTMMGSGG